MAMDLNSLVEILNPYFLIIELIVVLVVAFVIFQIISRVIKRYLMKHVKTKKQILNVSAFIDLINFIFVILLIIIAVISYYGNIGELGFVAGLLTVALGWALQKPISGVVGWLILIIKKPFIIGDRVLIKNIKGDVSNITLTHIYIDEIGGTIDGEEKSGRTVIIPTSIIFDEEVINYTEKDEYILDEVKVALTYESDLKKAEKITIDSVNKIIEPYKLENPKKFRQEPHNRIKFQDSGIDIIIRYKSIARKRNQISTDITREIFNRVNKEKNVEIAYPHTEVIFRNKK